MMLVLLLLFVSVALSQTFIVMNMKGSMDQFSNLYSVDAVSGKLIQLTKYSENQQYPFILATTDGYIVFLVDDPDARAYNQLRSVRVTGGVVKDFGGNFSSPSMARSPGMDFVVCNGYVVASHNPDGNLLSLVWAPVSGDSTPKTFYTFGSLKPLGSPILACVVV
jgi:hypothetical protein